jgi:hypothetical protein
MRSPCFRLTAFLIGLAATAACVGDDPSIVGGVQNGDAGGQDANGSSDGAGLADAGEGEGGDGGADDAAVDPGCHRRIDEQFAVGPINPSWTQTLNGGGSAAVAVVGGASALRAAVTSNGAYGVARIEQVFPAPLPKKATLTFSMRVVSQEDGIYLPGCTLQAFTSSATFFSAYPVIEDGQLRVEASVRLNDALGPRGPGLLGTVQPATSYRARFRFEELSATGAHAILDVDGVQKVDQTFTFTEAASLRVRCGVEYAPPGKAIDVLVDDVVLDVCP